MLDYLRAKNYTDTKIIEASGHTHTNKTAIDKISEDENGLLFDGLSITADISNSISQLSEEILTKNLYNPANLLSNNYKDVNGVLHASTSYSVVNDVDVVAGQIIVASYTGSGIRKPATMRYICAYDSGGNAVSASGVQNVTSYTVPEGITGLHITVFNTQLFELMIEVTADGIATAYEAYHEPIKIINQDAVEQAVTNLTAPLDSAIGAISSSMNTRINPCVNVILNHLFGGTKIYGTSWDKSSNSTLVRTDDAVGMTANVGVDMTTVVNDFDSADIFKDIEEVQDVNGNYFVRIPKFYIAKTVSGTSETLKISKIPIEGSYLPKCFWDFSNSTELAYFDFGKYLASSADDTVLDSKPDTYPLTYNKTINNFRTMAQANGVGYHQLDIHAWDVLQALMMIEFATLDIQSFMMGWVNGAGTAHDTLPTAVIAETGVNRIVISNADAVGFVVGTPIGIATTNTNRFSNEICYGRLITSIDAYDASNTAISFDGAAVDITADAMVYNVAWKNGFSSDIAATSGSIVSNSDGLHPCVYRGIENPYGNAFQWCDGINIEGDYKPWVCDNPSQYQSFYFASPYRQLSYLNSTATGNIQELGFDSENPFARLPITVNGTGYENNYYSDRYYQDFGPRTLPIGGYWAGGRYSGPFACWPAYGVNAGAMFAARLMRKAL